MIRPFSLSDLATVMQIWLESNISAHPFIPQEYWPSNLEAVKGLLPQADVFVYEEDNTIKGFIGIQDKSYIAGLFVSPVFQGHGIGRELVSAAKKAFGRLELAVYKRNEKAVKFYIRQGFKISSNQTDSNTGEAEYTMVYSPCAKSKLK